ncbi:MAG: aspartyl-tRNA(Asn)/glutamyl-tRNA(Gln) amidotransferase subunit C [Myxococcota bacterium]|jgi:aspartyl-tRNA(Asn)/glutamyl-tRNA(Gln) amidotransferase subunit C
MSDSPALSPDDVRAIARLARLELPEESLRSVAAELSSILGYVATLNELDLEGVPAFTHAFDSGTPLRADVLRPGLSHADALSQAPQRSGTAFVVPKVVG